MARALAESEPTTAKASFAFEFEQPAFLTLGVVLRGAAAPERRRVSVDPAPRSTSSSTSRSARRSRSASAAARRSSKLDDAVSAAVEKLKAKGLTSPYLKPFVVARVNYTRFSKATVVRLRRGARQDHRQRREVQRRARASRKTSPRPAAGRRRRRRSRFRFRPLSPGWSRRDFPHSSQGRTVRILSTALSSAFAL